jgi:hypothetical protein
MTLHNYYNQFCLFVQYQISKAIASLGKQICYLPYYFLYNDDSLYNWNIDFAWNLKGSYFIQDAATHKRVNVMKSLYMNYSEISNHLSLKLFLSTIVSN